MPIIISINFHFEVKTEMKRRGKLIFSKFSTNIQKFQNFADHRKLAVGLHVYRRQ